MRTAAQWRTEYGRAGISFGTLIDQIRAEARDYYRAEGRREGMLEAAKICKSNRDYATAHEIEAGARKEQG